MSDKDKNTANLGRWTFTFLGPTLIGKGFILYFGLNYSEHPGDGYGIGLAIALLFTLSSFGAFLWSNRNYVD